MALLLFCKIKILALVTGKNVLNWKFSDYWVIPENIHTIPRAASWNSEGEGGFPGVEFRRRGGVTQFGVPKAIGEGGFQL